MEALHLDVALRLSRQCQWDHGIMVGQLFTAVREISRDFAVLSPKYNTIAALDADNPSTKTSPMSAADLWQVLSDALRQSRQAQSLGMDAIKSWTIGCCADDH